MYSVAIYKEDMAFGGHEEGGWWYNAGELLERPVRYFRAEDVAYNYCYRLNRHLHHMINKRCKYKYTDVLSEGRLVADVHPGHPPRYYPETQPHYE